MIAIKGGVTTPKGFLASGIRAGIKRSGNKDLALLYSAVPAQAAAAFTTNRFKASPVKISERNISNKSHQAIIVNAGNANCANGKRGDKDALSMVKFVAEGLVLKEKEVLVASTGIIGHPLPVDKIKKHMPVLIGELSDTGGTSFARTILTTDTVIKEVAVKIKLGDALISIGGACKGVGMIHPEMSTAKHATLLCFITTDISISKKMLEAALDEAISDSFNMISVDGDMSTNDSCFILANGLAGNRKIISKDKSYYKFTEALKFLAQEFSRMLAKDGEGATKLVEIEVTGAGSIKDAKTIARKVSTSNLLKCAINGGDPNWGRVAASAGSSGVMFDPDKADIYIGNIKVLSNGGSIKSYNVKKAAKLFSKDEVYIKIDLKSGQYKAKAWTCDFSKEYVSINADYHT